MYNLEKFLSSVWLKSFSVNFHFCLEILENFHFGTEILENFHFGTEILELPWESYCLLEEAWGKWSQQGLSFMSGTPMRSGGSLLAQVVIENLEHRSSLEGVQQAGWRGSTSWLEGFNKLVAHDKYKQ